MVGLKVGIFTSSNLTPVDTKNMTNIDISVLKNSLESLEVSGSMLTKMMENMVTPYIGSNVDIRV